MEITRSMKSIEDVRADLRLIPNVMWEGTGDPFEPPRIFSNDDMETITRDASSRVMVDCDEPTNYPDHMESELLRDLDQKIGLKERQRRVEVDGPPHVDECQRAGKGLDALAWYVSFHSSKDAWGIFIPTSSLVYLEQRVFTMKRLSRAARLQAGFDLLLEHELFHFATDYVCAQWEVLMQAACWRFLAEKRLQKGGIYIRLEEALANAYMLRTLEPNWGKRVSRAVRRFVSRQPPGYNEAPNYVSEVEFDLGLADLARLYCGIQAVECGLNVNSTFDHGSIFPVRPIIPSGQCPIHIIHDLKRFGIPKIAVRSYPPPQMIVETEKFRKMLSSIPHDIIKKWNRKKDMLRQVGFPRPPEFENFKDHFSLRVGLNFRAHLRHVSGANYDWEAFEIGPHTKMGHG